MLKSRVFVGDNLDIMRQTKSNFLIWSILTHRLIRGATSVEFSDDWKKR